MREMPSSTEETRPIVIDTKITPNKDRTCRGKIPGYAERQFFLYASEICDKRGWQIQYEPYTYTIYYDNGDKISTSPDFLILRQGQKDICIELTRRNYDPRTQSGRDPKIRQKQIMSYFPNTTYLTLYRQHMDKLEKKHPPISFNPHRK